MEFNRVEIDFNKDYVPLGIHNLNSIKIINLEGEEPEKNIETIRDKIESEKYYFEGDNTLKCFNSSIVSFKKLKCTWREVVKVGLDVKLSFVPGDSIGILCPNSEYYVDEIFKILNIQDELYYIERTGTNRFKFVGKLSYFFKYFFDFNSLPKKSFLMDISRKTLRSEEIKYLCSKEGSRDYMRISKNWNDIIDIIYTFECKVNLNDILMNCEILKPRYFSLTNKIDSNCEIIIASVYKDIVYRNKNSLYNNKVKRKYGHVSQYFKDYNGEGDIRICLRESPLIRLNTSKRILMICTGTGIAPFMSFIRNYSKNQELWLIYGFRNVEDDISNEIIIPKDVKVTKCMSSRGEYVTNFIKDNRSFVSEFLEEDSSVYFCGRQEIQLEIYQIFSDYFPKIITEKKLFFDNWK